MTAAVSATPSVVPLEGQAARDALMRLVDETKYEILSALPDDARYDIAVMRSSWDNDVALLDRGIDARSVYPAQAVRDPQILEYLSQLAARGGKVRVTGTVPNRLVVADRSRAFVPDTSEGPGKRYLLISGKPLVRALYGQFIDLWRSSLPVGFSTGGLDVDLVRDTLKALSQGLTDEAAARKNGWSLRTYRRRIAAVLDILGTSSRFEAGALAREQGWI